jgi:hypothetical protein
MEKKAQRESWKVWDQIKGEIREGSWNFFARKQAEIIRSKFLSELQMVSKLLIYRKMECRFLLG